MKQTEILTHATHVNGWFPAVYMSCMSQNFRLFHVSNLSVRNFRIFLLMYTGSVSRLSAAKWPVNGWLASTRPGRPAVHDSRSHVTASRVTCPLPEVTINPSRATQRDGPVVAGWPHKRITIQIAPLTNPAATSMRRQLRNTYPLPAPPPGYQPGGSPYRLADRCIWHACRLGAAIAYKTSVTLD